MRSFKKFALCLIAAAISSYTYAEVIELNAFNPDQCRQQILKSNDPMPVIAAYTSDGIDGNSKSFMENFEVFAKAHPEKTFFKWDANKDMLHATQTLCLQQLGFFIPPNLILLLVIKDIDSGEAIMTAPLRLEWAGEMTVADMNRFIDVPIVSMRKAVFSMKNR